MTINSYISQATHIQESQIQSVLTLLNEGATIPFIARYRKDQTGNLEDHQIFTIQKHSTQYEEIVKRKESILQSIENLAIENADEIKNKINVCWNKKDLEDLYAPYKAKKNTKASIARANGLEGLAKIIMSQNNQPINIKPFIKNNIQTEEDAINGALDIIIEWISESVYSKNSLRRFYNKEAILATKFKKDASSELYKDYEYFSQLAHKMPSHRVLAILRGIEEGILQSSFIIDKNRALEILDKNFIKTNNTQSKLVQKAIQQAFTKNLKPSLEKELLKEIKQKADKTAIEVFSKNLEQLLLTAPIGKKNTLAIDPGFKSGCKIVVLNAQGDLLEDSIIYPHPPINKTTEASKVIQHLSQKHQIQYITIGNGTAGRETEKFIKSIVLNPTIQIHLVSECGASVYSASEIGREEFPNKDVTVRGAVSIGRRTMDPLAELVKIDPKSLGVGQYQHDVDQTLLKTELDYVVTRAVNKVGVQLNTASKHLLQYIAGIGPTLAQNIVQYRTENGKFLNIQNLKKVPRLGNKAFEQAAGFLRIEGDEILDNTAIHPEQYDIVLSICKKLNLKKEQLLGNKEVENILKDTDFVNSIGINTLKDIVSELQKPNIDPRTPIHQIEFNNHINQIEDLFEGMVLQGKVNNLTNFGAFVDLGIKENGLIHISQIANQFINNPAEVLQLHQIVTVKIIEINLAQKKISLSMKNL